MIVLSGTIQENTIFIENESIDDYDGKYVILTCMDQPYKKIRKQFD